MDPTLHILVIAAVVLVSALLQSLIGFGAGVTGIPLLVLLLGLDLQEAVAIILVASMTQGIIGTYALRRHLDWRATLRPSLIRFAALPLGNLALLAVGSMGQHSTRQAVGIILLLIVVAQWLWKVEPSETLSAGWEWLAFSLGGFLLGFCGMGGPPIALWVMAHRWSTEKSKAFLFFLLFSGMIPQLFCLGYLFGDPVLRAMGIGVLMIPVVFVGAALGLWVSTHINRHRWRQITLAALGMLAIAAVLSPLQSP